MSLQNDPEKGKHLINITIQEQFLEPYLQEIGSELIESKLPTKLHFHHNPPSIDPSHDSFN